MKRVHLAALGLSSLALVAWARAEGPKLQELIGDTQKQSVEDKRIAIAWWIPTEYWQTALASEKQMPDEAKKQIYSAFDPYVLLAIVDGEITQFGGFQPRTAGDVGKELSVRLANGKSLKAVSLDDLNAEAKAMLGAMKPALANSIGKLGEGMHFFFFEGRDKAGNRIIDPTKEGGFTIALGDEQFRWRLPLGSLLPAKYDPKTGEKFPGNYLFSPFTGAPLTTEAPQ